MLASARNRAPRVAEPGEAREERTLRLELRTVADVGLVGLPNAGKSTLLVAPHRRPARRSPTYPFTTLTPNLGVAGGDGDRFVVADVPGADRGRRRREGARAPVPASRRALSRAGVGRRSLRGGPRRRPRRRCGPSSARTTRRSPRGRPSVVGTKTDLVDDARERADAPAARSGRVGDDGGGRSTISWIGSACWRARPRRRRPPRRRTVVLRPGRPHFAVTRRGSVWEVHGPKVERWVMEADLDDEDEVARLQPRFKKEGIDRALAARGRGPATRC